MSCGAMEFAVTGDLPAFDVNLPVSLLSACYGTRRECVKYIYHMHSYNICIKTLAVIFYVTC